MVLKNGQLIWKNTNRKGKVCKTARFFFFAKMGPLFGFHPPVPDRERGGSYQAPCFSFPLGEMPRRDKPAPPPPPPPEASSEVIRTAQPPNTILREWISQHTRQSSLYKHLALQATQLMTCNMSHQVDTNTKTVCQNSTSFDTQQHRRTSPLAPCLHTWVRVFHGTNNPPVA